MASPAPPAPAVAAPAPVEPVAAAPAVVSATSEGPVPDTQEGWDAFYSEAQADAQYAVLEEGARERDSESEQKAAAAPSAPAAPLAPTPIQ